MTGRAEIRLAGRGGVFVADGCEIAGPFVHATGRWRWRTGANCAELRYSEPITRTWPAHEVREIRWQNIEVTA